MLDFFVRRLLSAILAIWVVITVTFFVMHAIPGGPFQRDKVLPPAIKENIEARYKLNDPLLVQYKDYLLNLLKGDLGPSFKYRGQTVNGIISRRFPVSLQLGLVAFAIALTLGVSAGIMAALNQGNFLDYLTMSFSTLGVAIPSFILGTLLMLILSYKLGLLPAATWGTPLHIIMPAISLSALPTAYIARLTRSSMLDVLNQDYMKTAKAKGLPKRRVVWIHAIKNAIIPVLTYSGPLLAGIITGTFVVENIFAVPGLGKHFVTSIYNRDYTVILGMTVFYSIFLIGLNMLVDIAYSLFDPRIKLTERKE